MIDTEARTLHYTNAGHNFPILVRADGSVIRLDDGGFVLGFSADACYTQASVRLESGDRLLLFTDGIVEAEAADGSEFSDDHLVDIVRTHRGDSAWRIVDTIVARVNSFAGGHFRDDATLLAVAIR